MEHLSSKLCDFIFEKNLTQLVNVPTHNHGNMLDLILTNMPENTLNLEADKQLSSFSFFLLVLFATKVSFKQNKQNPDVFLTTRKLVWNYYRLNYLI